MSSPYYSVEFDGDCYIVFKEANQVGAFSSLEDAFAAKRDFVSKKLPQNWQKIPPAMRFAKRQLYGVA
ncbi:MAG: hypothetical protein JXK16_10010 [Thiotrichales bacterium]|nr:hypothetical protein [Thiotrichales bacterium]